MGKKNYAQKPDLAEVSKLLFKSASEGLVVVDDKGIIQLVNPSLLELFNYSEEELVGKPVEILIPNELAKGHVGHREAYSSQPTKKPMGKGQTMAGKRKDGSTFPVEISLNHFKLNGQLMVMCLVSDITIRHSITWALQKEREIVQAYLDVARTMFVLLDTNGNVIMINKRGAMELGYEESEIKGKNWFDNFIPKLKKAETIEVFKMLQLSQHGEMETYQNPIVTKYGKEILITWNNLALRNDDGSFIGTLSSGENITQLHEANEELKNLNAQLEKGIAERTKTLKDNQHLYQQIARNFPNGSISVIDKNFDYVFIEGAELNNKRIVDANLLGTNFIKQVPDEQKDAISKKLKSILKGGEVSWELKTQNNTHMVCAVGMPNDKGGVKYILMVSQNITKLKKAEEDISRSLQKERHLNEMKSRFVSMASHEFRTPLTTIMNSASILSKYQNTNPNKTSEKRHIERIKNSVNHLTSILNDFLSLDKLDGGKIEPHLSHFNASEFLRDVIENMEGSITNGKKITYQYQGEQFLELDERMLKNIFHNLLSNALKYSNENSEIRVETRVDKHMFEASVSNMGMGIPLEEQPHLFERFFRAQNVLNIQGTGLGLNIVKKYLTLLGGDIQLESVPEEKTTFTIRIPIPVETQKTRMANPNRNGKNQIP